MTHFAQAMSDKFSRITSSDRVLRSSNKQQLTNGGTHNSPQSRVKPKANKVALTNSPVLTKRKRGKGRNKNKGMDSGDDVSYDMLDNGQNQSDEDDLPNLGSRKMYEMHQVQGEKVHLLEDSQQQEDDVSFIMEGKGEEQESFWSITIQVFIPFLIAGMGMVGAGLVLDVVQVC